VHCIKYARRVSYFYSCYWTKEQSREQPKAEQRTSNEGADTNISLSGPGDATTPPTYLAKGTLIMDVEHSPSEDAPQEWDYDQFVVQVNDSEGKVVTGGYVWQEAPTGDRVR
jgi:hypothetical protein